MSTGTVTTALILLASVAGGSSAIAAQGTALALAQQAVFHYGEAKLSEPTYKVLMQANVRVPMRDGVKLAADIYRPDAPGRFPALLVRTPYGKESARDAQEGRWFAARGYVVIRQDVRGRYDSGGQYYAFRSEADDGYDTDEWIGAQAWFDGNLGTIGGSYMGYVQWAQAMRGSRYLKAMAPSITTPDAYNNWIYSNGALHYGFALPWGGLHIESQVNQYVGDFDWKAIFNHLPVATSDAAGHHFSQHYRDWMLHPTRDHYWDGISFENDYNKIGVPILTVDGWYDLFLRGALQDDIQVRKAGKTALARNGKRLIVGPWAHGGVGARVVLPNGGSFGAPANLTDYGADAALDMNRIYLRWFDHWLKGVDNGVEHDAPVRIFVMGENRWRNEHEWPLARTKYTNYYINSGGRANSSAGDGALSTQPPKGSGTDTFTYDPASPVPSLGSNICCTPVPAGPWDQREIERRNDVLVYTTPALTQPIEITGPIVMKLFAATSAADTDWTAKLVDVQPDGSALNIQSGIVRARYREGVGKPARPIVPGKVYEYTIDLWATSLMMPAGHRLRLEISSSDFPTFDRNLNTGEDSGTGTRMATARQTIYHSARYPSHVILPLIPRSENAKR